MRKKVALLLAALVLALTLGLSGTALADDEGPLNVDTSFSDGNGVGVDGNPSSCGGDSGPVNFNSLIQRFACEKYGSGSGASYSGS